MTRTVFIWVVWVATMSLLAQSLSGQSVDGRKARHVFPQFVNGSFPDGSSYRSTLVVTNPPGNGTANCLFWTWQIEPIVHNLGGEIVTFDGFFDFDLGSGQSEIYRTLGVGVLEQGFLTLSCGDVPVVAQVTFSLRSASGQVLSEASVFSAPFAQDVMFVADQRDGSRLGIAIANDTFARDFLITISGGDGTTLDVVTVQTESQGHTSFFVDELTSVSLPRVFTVMISSTRSDGICSVFDPRVCLSATFVTGLRFSGNAFTTILPVDLAVF